MNVEANICLCRRILGGSLDRPSLMRVLFYILIGQVNLVALGNQHSFSQTPGKQSANSTSQESRAKLLRYGLSEEITVTPAENPYANLIVLVGDRLTVADQAIRCSRKLGAAQTSSHGFFLRGDGTFAISQFHLGYSDWPSENVEKLIRSSAPFRDNFILKLEALDGKVDYESVFKAIQSLNGIEKRFKNFKIIASFSKVAARKAELKPPTKSGDTADEAARHDTKDR